MKMKEKNMKIFDWISLGLIYIIPMLVSFLFLKVPTTNRIDTGIYRDDPANYPLIPEMMENQLIEQKYAFYLVIIILLFVLIRFIGMIKYKKMDLFSSSVLVLGVLYFISVDYSMFTPLEHTSARYFQIIYGYDGNNLYSISIIGIDLLLLLYPIKRVIQYIINRRKSIKPQNIED